MSKVHESVLEEAALDWFRALGYEEKYGPGIGPGELLAERASYADVILAGRFGDALRRLNPEASEAALDDAARKPGQPRSMTQCACRGSNSLM